MRSFTPSREDSVSSMSQSPELERENDRPGIIRASNGSAPNTNGVPETPLSPNGAIAESSVDKVSGEAVDYLNGGLPHGPQSPTGPSSPRGYLAARESGNSDATPNEFASPGRRSVQFARSEMVLDPPPSHTHVKQDSWDGLDVSGRSRGERFMSKLKSFAAPGTSQTPKSPQPSEHAFPSANSSPVMSRSNRVPDTLNEEGSDADVEESGDDEGPRQTPKASRRKRMRRRLKNLDLSAPGTTPKLTGAGEAEPLAGHRRFNRMVRRSTMPDSSEHRGGLSEGEGRDHLTGVRRAWGRGSSWISSSRNENGDDLESPRLSAHRRRISEMWNSGGVSDGDAVAARRPRFGTERATTFGVHRWKQVKNSLKMLGGKKKNDQLDLHKSAELMAELRAVTPVVMMLASMIQRDEHGHKRIPVLLEQLNLRITDSQPSKSDKEEGRSERHWLFTIALEYGSGPSRMKWTVQRSIRDIANLHARYKLSALNNDLQATTTIRSKQKQPSFPSGVFPWARGLRGVDSDEEKPLEPMAEETAAEATAGEITAEGTASEMDRPTISRRKKSRMNLLGGRRQSEVGEGSSLNPKREAMKEALKRKKFIEKQIKVIEKYLQDMIHWLMFRPDSNRLCRFLELSALGVRLAAEGNYHGKECFLHIQSSAGIDFRRVLTPSKVLARHGRKWFMVRQHYIVVAESPSTMNIYDVFLVDPSFRIVFKKNKLKQLKASSEKGKGKRNENAEQHHTDEDEESSGKHHTVKIYTAERKIKLFSRNQNLMHQFEQSVTEMLKHTEWSQPHRFSSFAPVRQGAFAQWLVDGRDYMWNVSRAISMAQDVIYIHDWWLSPELYMRRPPAISSKWRLDRLLQRKAREGVKVFVIVYRNVEQAIPIDSEHTKFSLLNLHPNIMIQRSPNQLKKNQFFYAHHEKVCIVDHDVAFCGGIDLCFGRWDNPQHPLADDRPTGYEPEGETPRDAEHCQLWPGKDYSNPRVLDFFKLDEPYEEMYDRSRTPRMPWHDIAMQVVGQPARDLTRHFIQRWNYLRRERKPTRPIPFLLPPPDATRADLEDLGLTGTCEVQILRSAGDWSLGFPKDVIEKSIQTAYLKLIEESEHFVYMENQFFISSTNTLGTQCINRIGDALVERIIRAHENDEEWQCCILIPLMPGFQNTVDQDAGSSVRLIMQFQYRSICRGPNSIFGRLRAVGIEPEDFIKFFSLRQWGKIGNNHLVTEQLYIHAKTIIVDDRVALIGSANINERSMNGNRDSEVAAMVRDTDMIWSTMAGKPYQVGRFAHTLRMRLMREHLGLDVDQITEEERQAEADADSQAQYEAEMEHIYGDDNDGEAGPSSWNQRPHVSYNVSSFNHEAIAAEDPGFSSSSASSSSSKSPRGKSSKRKSKLTENKKEKPKEATKPTTHNFGPFIKGPLEEGAKGNDSLPPKPALERRTTTQLGLTRHTQLPDLPATDDTDIGGPSIRFDDAGQSINNGKVHPLAADIQLANIDKDCMRDPVNPAYWDEIWNRVAANNTKLYRRVFRCMPDSEVLTWADYSDFVDYAQRFNESMAGSKKSYEHEAKPPTGQVGGSSIGIAVPSMMPHPEGLSENIESKTNPEANPKFVFSNGDGTIHEKTEKPNLNLDTEKVNGKQQPAADAPSPVQTTGNTPFPAYDGQSENQLLEPMSASAPKGRERHPTFSSADKPISSPSGSSPAKTPTAQGSTRRRRRATTKGSSRRGAIYPYDVLSREEAEELLGMIQGHLVQFAYDWLETEEKDNHWLYQTDLMAPKEIYD